MHSVFGNRDQCTQFMRHPRFLCPLNYNILFPSVHPAISPTPCPATSSLSFVTVPALKRHTVPLIPTTGYTDMFQEGIQSLDCEVGLIYMQIKGKAEISQILNLGNDNMVNETLASVLRCSTCHSHFSSVIHQGPGHWRPIRPHQTEAGEGADTALDELLASLVATKIPDTVHQGSMLNI